MICDLRNIGSKEFDEALESVQPSNPNPKLCAVPRCNVKIHLLRKQCRFCARWFCYGHCDPIFHSPECEKLQKLEIERNKVKEIKQIKDLRKRGEPMSDAKRKELKDKFNAKMEDTAKQRQKKMFRNKDDDKNNNNKSRNKKKK